MKLLRTIAIALAAILVASVAHAARVRFVSDAGETFDRRVVAELASVGFDVERPDSREAPLLPDTVAIVAVSEEPARVEVWLVVAGAASLKAVIDRDSSTDDDTDSLRVAERLRAMLQPLAALPPKAAPAPPVAPAPLPPPEPKPEPPAAPARASEPPAASMPRDAGSSARGSQASKLAFDVAAAALSQPGGVALSGLLRARYDFAPPFGAGLYAFMPLTSTRIDQAGASADIDARMVGAGAHLQLLGASRDWQLRASAGCLAAWLTAVGRADAPREGHTERGVSAVPFLALDGSRRIAGDFIVGAGALAGVSLPRADVQFAGEWVATWGRPLLLAHVGVGYAP